MTTYFINLMLLLNHHFCQAMESRALRSELAAERIDCASQVAVASESALTARAHAESLDARLESATRAAAERLELQKVAEGRAVSVFFSPAT